MQGNCRRLIFPGDTGFCTTEAKVDVLVVRAKSFVQQPDLLEDGSPIENGCPGCELYFMIVVK